MIRRCRQDEQLAVLDVVNQAARAYEGVIPADRWHDPYMSADQLQEQVDQGVAFWGYEDAGALVGVMGLQPVRDVDLVRHAYVLPTHQGRGVGSRLLQHLLDPAADRPVLVGTWAAAQWAVAFYERHGFSLVPQEQVAGLLQTYWDVPARQVETSVVLRR